MTRYLAPTDFSEEATVSVKEAARRARLDDGELPLLHAFSSTARSEQIGHPRAFPIIDEEARASNEVRPAERWESIGEHDVRFRAVARRGVAAEQICSVADEESVDLIIMAKHGSGRLREILLGSTTAKVVREAPCSVRVFRPRGA